MRYPAPVTVTRIDQRSALKANRRAQILQAAAALIAERGTAFAVDELAERAGVARRTVFNHFGSIAGVVLALAEERIAARIAQIQATTASQPSAGDGRAALFEEIARTLVASDLAAVVTDIEGLVLGLDEARAQALIQQAFSRASAGLERELLQRHPDVDPLRVAILVSSLVSGITVIASRWVAGPGRLDPAGRAEWDRLLAALIHDVRAGYPAD